jgi:hypothetical protein
MPQRMLCTDCLHVAVPDTLLEGFDVLELLGWLCLAVPGLVYCWWRHLNRHKVCPLCGGMDLVREARAAAARRLPDAEPSDGPRIHTLSQAVDWPRALRTPRARLRSGSVAAVLLGLALAAHATQAAPPIALGSVLLCVGWIALQLVQVSRMRATLPGCYAWDECGRPLRIEQI